MQSHAAVPIAEQESGSLYRVYFSTRDQQNRSYTGSMIIDVERPETVLEIEPEPALSPGNLGEFDDSGAMATWLTKSAGQQYLYYIGWNLGVTVPFRNSIGLAIDSGRNHFERYAPGPIIDRSVTEPHFCASCCVLYAPECWRMWYVSCTGWPLHEGRPRHRYHLKYAESEDGIVWRRNGTVAIDFATADEYAISRPSVIHDGERFRMWYSWRGARYRIGYAESENGVDWVRLDHLVYLPVSGSGWDSEMVEYPFVFEHQGQLLMLYNGNGYGKSGVGLAILD